MLVDKYNIQSNENPLSPRNFLQDNIKATKPNMLKFPRISNGNLSSNQAQIAFVSTPKNNKLIIHNPPAAEKPVTFGEENPVPRGPKVLIRNLPEDFIPATPGAKRLKKLVDRGSDANLRNESSSEKKNPKRVNTTNQPSRNSDSFISPVRLIQMKNPAKKQNPYSNDSGYLSTVESVGKNPLVTPEAGIFNSKAIKKIPPSAKSQSPRQSFSVNNLAINVQSDMNVQQVSSGPNLQEKVEKNLDELGKQIKKLIIFKKVNNSKSPESKFFSEPDEVKFKVVNKEALNTQILQLNELITIRKIKTTQSHGAIKRMIHAPTLKIFDIEEEPISELKSIESVAMKEWINTWRDNFTKSPNLVRIYTCFWNSPEGCVSILTEPAKNGFLLDLINSSGSLPESCIKTIAKDILTGISEIHGKLSKGHGNICPSQILIGDKECKLCPGVSYTQVNSPNTNRLLSEEARSKNESVDYTSRSAGGWNLQNTISQDIFDFGLTLLQCAIGDLTFVDPSFSFTPENLKLAVESITAKKNYKTSCCIFHSEEVIRKSLGLINSTNGPVRKKILTNNFSIKSPNPTTTSKSNGGGSNHPSCSFQSLLNLGGRFSESFIDFLCCCLKIDPSQRPDASVLLNHEFLSSTHKCSGPSLELPDLIRLEQGAHQLRTPIAKKHLDKFMEALNVVFLNREVKQKLDAIIERVEKRTDDKRIHELASELGVSPGSLFERLKECLRSN